MHPHPPCNTYTSCSYGGSQCSHTDSLQIFSFPDAPHLLRVSLVPRLAQSYSVVYTIKSPFSDRNPVGIDSSSNSEELLPGYLSESNVQKFAFQIACGLEHLEAMEVN